MQKQLVTCSKSYFVFMKYFCQYFLNFGQKNLCIFTYKWMALHILALSFAVLTLSIILLYICVVIVIV